MTQVTRQKFDNLLPSAQAGILCGDDRFQRFAAVRSGFPGGQFTNQATAEYLRTVCRVESRRELDIDWNAKGRLERLRTEFDAWTGRIASQR